ncbi:hypothetical protein [Limosilactobacillus reuteri]|uniref:hypothetical protein n=1 Tax=Limosilactobacillus reuteri TaxID=1598 RepID=UPI001E50B24F|nr:hypothetical protein [Limosilactobacillus reuteri]MCC4468147.1 hypothetical protein [Limosilactobacillus reuteri]MCC4474225.1 hypothetical protein [Limosilactobacillus reuteri]
MALRKTKSTSLTGESVINGTTVVRMTASLSTNGGSDSVNQYVQNVDLYNANKRDVRKDIAAFQDYVYEQQDAIDAEIAADKEEATDSEKKAAK